MVTVQSEVSLSEVSLYMAGYIPPFRMLDVTHKQVLKMLF